ncbi:MAG: GGDEF domain-containing protein [Nitrospiraceae bacterium]|nr:MAG: GGDEF domain-containing protein [Nitrospiraceae bacterium]
MNTDSLLQNISSLPSLPAVAVKIIQEIRKDKSSIGKLADIISVDPALTAKMLKVANSSFYGLSRQVDSVERAINVLGLEAIKNIALSFVIVKGFKRDSVDEFNQELFWKRAVTAAVGAELMASKLKRKREDIFVTALLMDIGVLVMYLDRPDDYLTVINEKIISETASAATEKAVFGFDHQEAGSEILKAWGIPENIYMPISCHHKTQDAASDWRDTSEILMLSDMASSVYYGNRSTEKLRDLGRLLHDRLGMTGSDVNAFIDSIAEKTLEILTCFDIDAVDVKPYSEIMSEAAEEIGPLNMTYEQLAMELRQEKKKTGRLAAELKNSNEKLKMLANKDGLTGIYNHRFFQEFLDREVERAERYSRNLSLIIMDIDHFRKVNEAYGYNQGDLVLRALAELFQQVVRKPDIVVRYGGEEFAVVIPEADIRKAIIIAERLRKMVERLEIKIEGQAVKVTISAGLSMYEPQKNMKDKAKLVEAAGKALHYSKVTGRNKISVVPLAGN